MELRKPRTLPRPRRLAVAHAFTLMLEPSPKAARYFRRTIVYVLTAHPTESRARIALLAEVQTTLRLLPEASREFASVRKSRRTHLLRVMARRRASRAPTHPWRGGGKAWRDFLQECRKVPALSPGSE